MFLFTVIPVILLVAFFTVAERKVMAAVQSSSGPGFYTSAWGIFQGLFDGVKLLLNEMLIVSTYNYVFVLTPVLLFALSLLTWFIVPLSNAGSAVSVSFSLLILLVVLSLSVLGPILAGWSSCNNYAWYGALRGVNQVLQYEVILTLCVLPVALLSSSLHIDTIVISQNKLYFGLPLFFLSVLFFICNLVETNSAPFDLPETESELVAGFHVEYSGILFALFFLAEYSFMAISANLNVLLSWGGWNGCNYGEFSQSFNACFFYFLFIIVSASFPRIRFDQLILMSWNRIMPVLLSSLLVFIGLRI